MISPTVTTSDDALRRVPAPRPAAVRLSRIDKSKLTGVQWQFTTAMGTDNHCTVDITIDNVMFF